MTQLYELNATILIPVLVCSGRGERGGRGRAGRGGGVC